jgi:hypothetical protein
MSRRSAACAHSASSRRISDTASLMLHRLIGHLQTWGSYAL